MHSNISFYEIVNKIQKSDNQEQIKYYCSAFCKQAGFDNYLVVGYIFTSLLSPSKYILGSLGKAVKNQSKQIEHIIRSCMNRSTPIITGKYSPKSPLNNSLFNPFRTPSAKGISVSFPVHFPVGKFACLYISTNDSTAGNEEQIMNILAPGNQFAREAGNAVLRLLEAELSSKASCLSAREKQCLMLATDGLMPPQIAEQVGLSTHTVIFHLKKAREKLESKNIQGAVSKAILRGDIETNV